MASTKKTRGKMCDQETRKRKEKCVNLRTDIKVKSVHDVKAIIKKIDRIKPELKKIDRIKPEIHDVKAIIKKIDRIKSKKIDKIKPEMHDVKAIIKKIDRIKPEIKKIDRIKSEIKKIDRIKPEIKKIDRIKPEIKKIDRIKPEIKKIDRIKQKNLDSQISRKRKRANSETEEIPSEDLDLKELSKKHILQCISAIFHLTQERLKEKNDLLVTEVQPIFMQVTCVKVPKVPQRQMRTLLPYSIVAPNDEVALFVCDLQRGRRKDYEPTVEHYKNLLDKCECTRVTDVIPINRVKTEFDQFELKKKLLGSYDHFLVDGRIAGHMSHLLGKPFIKNRKLPTSINMESKDLKHEIDYALRKTSMHLHSNGDTHVVQIGNTSMRKKNIFKNILATCKNLSKNYPGGWTNIRALRLKSTTTLALPFYITLKKKNLVAPSSIVVPPKRPRAYHNVEGELSTFLGSTTVTVKPDGQVILNKRTKRQNMKEAKKNKKTEN